MPVYVSTTYFGDGSDIQGAIDKLEQEGISKIELGSNHKSCNVHLLKLDTKASYVAHNYFPSKDPDFILNIASQNSQIRNKSINFIKETIKICKQLRIKFYTIHPGFLGETLVNKSRVTNRNFDFKFKISKGKIIRREIISRTIMVIKSLISCANANGVHLLIENEGSKSSSKFVLFDSASELDLLKKGLGNELKFNFNLAHAILAGINLNDSETFKHFYKNSEFFEVSEINGVYDSHLPVFLRNGQTSTLLKKYKSYFARKNIILEYRNINIKEVIKSYESVKEFLDSPTPVI